MKRDTDLVSKTAVLYCDTRLGGVKQWIFGNPEDAKMRVPDKFLESICFICVKVKDAHGETDFFIGTGFFASVQSAAIPEARFLYLVTARHIIKEAKDEGYSEFYIRLNTHDGSSITASIPDAWEYADNPAIDIAVMPMIIGDAFKNSHIPIENFVTDEVARENGIGIGDDLFMVGLFSHRWGHQRNIPILRSGVIASMPEEPFVDEEGRLYDSYLVETRSIGGLSGSPVFVYLDALRGFPEKKTVDATELRSNIYLLGVVRGHWDLKRQDAAPDSIRAKVENEEIDRLNTGIAQATPIEEVLTIINGEKLMKARQVIDGAELKRRQPTLDSNLPRKESNSEITQEGFQDALKRASRKISPDEEKTEPSE